jgi:hypothetical protein
VTEPGPVHSQHTTADAPASRAQADGPVTTLRGAGAAVDMRRAARGAVALVLVTLAVLVVVFVVVGVNKNHQADELRNDGVPVTYTVTRCQGLLGGSGSNPVGYSCHGFYRIDGHTYDEVLPGSALYAPGTQVRGVSDPSDPGLLSTPAIVRGERSSWNVFILPAILFVILVTLIVIVFVRLRSSRRDAA